MNKKSTIAKLLANEDIHVVSKPMATAYFNVKTRELGLPVWKDDITVEEEELMVSHEIGHALWTSMDLITYGRNRGLNQGIINVLEDARIEKFVKSKYPGTVNLFNKGYRSLIARDFFGIGDTDPQKQNLIDRINLYFKGMSNITFTDEESVFVKRTAELRTEAEVLDLAADITQYMKDNPEQDNDDSDESDDSQESMTDNHATGESDNESGDESDDESNDESGSSDESADESGSSDESADESKDESTNDYEPESKTDNAANESVKDLADLDATEKVYARIPKIDSDKMIVDYKTIIDELSEHYTESSWANNRSNWVQHSLDQIRAFKNDSKKSVAYMVKEFEMKKAADQYARAATSKTGTLDMGALHTYKFNDDLFRKVTTLPGATNHGMIMVLDWSGSMSENLVNTFNQLMQLVWFCRRTQIPFEVFAFTKSYRDRSDSDCKYLDRKIGDMAITEHVSLLNFFSSRMNAAEEEKMMHYVWMLVKRLSPYYEDWRVTGYPVDYCRNYYLSATPLNESIIAMMDYAPKFKKRTGVQKLNTIFLTDGESDALPGVWNSYDERMVINRYGEENLIIDPVTNNQYEMKCARYSRAGEATPLLLKALKARVSEMNVLGFFIAGRGKQGRIDLYTWMDILGADKFADAEKAKKVIKKDGALVLPNTKGYDEFYVIQGGNQLAVDNNLELDDGLVGASKAKLKTAFSKASKKRAHSRVLLNKFTAKVA
jgi:hypothetical protein